jgi:hypothetical protein
MMSNEEIVKGLKLAQSQIAASRDMCEDEECEMWDIYEAAIARLSVPALTVYELWGTNQGQEIHYFTKYTPHEMKALLKRLRESENPIDLHNYRVVERTTVETVKEW